MLNLILCEFRKLKRRRFLLLVALAACLFPFPVTILAMRGGTDGAFDIILFLLMAWIGVPLMVPAMGGVIASMLFHTERDNGTLKNLYAIPVSWPQLAGAKIFVIVFLSVVFSVVTFSAAVLAAILAGGAIDGAVIKLCASFLTGIFYAAVTLPAVFLVIWLNRSTILSILISILYAVIQDMLVWGGIYTISSSGMTAENFDLSAPQLWSLPMMIFRWFPYFINTDYMPEVQSAAFFVPLWMIAAVCTVIAAISVLLIFYIGKRREV